MNSENTRRFLAAMETLAASDDSGLRMFRVRGKSTCVANLAASPDGTVAVNSLVGLEGAPMGRAYALSGICYLADIFDTCLVADGESVFRDVGGGVAGSSWLQDFGFLTTRSGELVRLPRSLKSQQAA